MNIQHLDTPEAAEQAFYEAFMNADPAAMAALWEPAAAVACIHPMGHALIGTEAVQRGWGEIFAAGQRLHIHIEHLSWQVRDGLAVSVVHEHIRLVGEDKTSPPIVATNVYRHTPAGWRIAVHHASPAVVETVGATSATRHLH